MLILMESQCVLAKSKVRCLYATLLDLKHSHGGLQVNYAGYTLPHPANWVLILPTSEGKKAESTLSRLPGIEPWVMDTVLTVVQQFNHYTTRLLHRAG